MDLHTLAAYWPTATIAGLRPSCLAYGPRAVQRPARLALRRRAEIERTGVSERDVTEAEASRHCHGTDPGTTGRTRRNMMPLLHAMLPNRLTTG